ncbi:hypothetical protein TNCT_437011, partial [Trichonephila clavata]
LDGLRRKNTMDDEEQLGDENPKVIGRTTEGDTKFQEQYKHSISLDKLIEKNDGRRNGEDCEEKERDSMKAHT